MSRLFSPDILEKIIAVIDLRDGQAVHAVAGNRHQYQPVAIGHGDPNKLIQHYSQLGVGGIYIADLDALTGGPMQTDAIRSLCELAANRTVWLDVGWHHDVPIAPIKSWADEFKNVHWIAATESCQSVDDLHRLSGVVSPERTFLGLDLRHGKLIAQSGDTEEWLATANRLGCAGTVVLDLASVGTANGPPVMEICRSIKASTPRLKILSGGGVRHAADIESLIQAGCDQCLVATALHK